MHHTYVNSPGCIGAESTADIPDIDFLTDANVYYNLPPPPPPSAQGRSAASSLSLPRGHLPSPQLSSFSSSCPSSPKLPPAVVPRRGNFTPPRHHSVDRTGRGHFFTSGGGRVSTTPPSGGERGGGVTAGGLSPCAVDKVLVATTPPPVKERVPKGKNKKLAHTRSFDLDHLYQNLVRVATKPRSNSFSVPWKKKKKSDAAAAAGIKEEGSCSGLTTSDGMIPDGGADDTSTCVRHQDGSPLSPAGTRSSKTTSSSNSSDSDTGSESVLEDCPAEICPGVTYLRESVVGLRNQAEANQDDALNSWYHSAATLPLRDTKAARNHFRTSGPPALRHELPIRNFDVTASLDEWRRKERWLEKKRSSRNLRQTGESGEVHVVILYAADGVDWMNYLHELFTQMVPKEEGYQAVRVEVKNVEDIQDKVTGLQAVRLKEARLQIVIISPRFMAHIAGHGRTEIGKLFEPEKVLGLLLGVNDSQFSMAHLSVLYSYKDWHRLNVRNLDLTFVEEVLSEAIKILNNNKLYVDCPDERSAKFKVTSRKVTMTQKQVYIMLNEEVTKADDIEVLIEVGLPARKPTIITKWHILNPYTIWFSMPEEFLKTSSLVLVSLILNQEEIGSRQLKCESNMDTLRDILGSVSNPTELMCQALNINPISEDLDQKLAEKVRLHMPLSKIEEPMSKKGGAEFPTWIHFSAFYGLERLTWALLEIPGAEEALSNTNFNGHTPSILAYQKGFYSLAQKLEDAALVSSLASKVCNMPRLYGDCSLLKENAGSSETYNNPPPPRPLAIALSSSVIANYDTLPAPRIVDPSATTPGAVTPPDSLNTSPIPNLSTSNYSKSAGEDQSLSSAPLSPDNSCAIPLSPVPIRHKTKANEKHVDCYLDMNVSAVDRHGKLYEYSEDVYTLVEAWNERINIRAFVEKNQDKIDDMKNKLENTQLQLNNGIDERLANDEVLPAVPEENNRISNDALQQKTMVDKFISLLQDTYSEGDEGKSSCSCQPGNGTGQDLRDLVSNPSPPHPDKMSRTYKKLATVSPPCSSVPPQASFVNEDRPPAPPPRPTTDHYLSHDEVITPHQFEISVELKKLEEEEKTKCGKCVYPTLSKSTANLRSPYNASANINKSTSTRTLQKSEENNVEEDELYTKLTNI